MFSWVMVRDRSGPMNLRQLYLVLVHPQGEPGEHIARHVRRLVRRVEMVWPPPAALAENADVLMCLLDSCARQLVNAVIARSDVAVVGIVDPQVPETVKSLRQSAPHGVLCHPVNPLALAPSLLIAYGNLGCLQRQLGKVRKLEETLRAYKKVQQAKAILMERRNIGEPEAYGFLRDEAMRRRMAIGAIASIVVESHDVLLSADDRG
ncbi:MAG: ANTAR domain-containing protein [Alphaproteobacteria bacterium]|nr:ANTAR domain-containing protein [Alphaproteobacteria bacterium]